MFIGLLNPIILLGLVLNFAAVFWIGRQVQRLTVSKNEELAHCDRRADYCYKTSSDFAYGKDARLYRMQNSLLANYRKQTQAWVTVLGLIKNREFTLGFLSLFTLLLSDAATYLVLIVLVVRGMSLADFSMYLAATVSLSAYLTAFSESLATLLNEMQYVSDFYSFEDADLGEQGGGYIAAKLESLKIEFKNMSFRYPNTEKFIFQNLNLTIAPGEKLAIVGINGAGKSTLVKLMCGLFDPTEGELLLNGVPVGQYNKKYLYSLYSVVFQEPVMLAFSIQQNVACCAKDIDEDRVRDCLQQAGLWEKVSSLPKGMNQPMLKIIEDDGIELSGGQTQKLAIARALYRQGAAVIMDEPTAALDALAEAEIYQQFDRLVQGKTAIYISHRLASTRFCDHIALFDNDGLKEYGTHDELMAANGSYCEMFTVQGRYYREGVQADA
ncbi:MAG: ABC transporter ATP-binding protein [Angelakisella sp.]